MHIPPRYHQTELTTIKGFGGHMTTLRQQGVSILLWMAVNQNKLTSIGCDVFEGDHNLNNLTHAQEAVNPKTNKRPSSASVSCVA